MQVEILTQSRAEFEDTLRYLDRRGIVINDSYEPELKILITGTRKRIEQLESKGFTIRGN